MTSSHTSFPCIWFECMLWPANAWNHYFPLIVQVYLAKMFALSFTIVTCLCNTSHIFLLYKVDHLHTVLLSSQPQRAIDAFATLSLTNSLSYTSSVTRLQSDIEQTHFKSSVASNLSSCTDFKKLLGDLSPPLCAASNRHRAFPWSYVDWMAAVLSP